MARRKRKGLRELQVFLNHRSRPRKRAITRLFSPHFAYAMCKKLDGRQSDAGTTIWWSMRVHKAFGSCDDHLFPHDSSLSDSDLQNHPITKEMLENAYENRIRAYQRLFSLDDIRNVIDQNKPYWPQLGFDIFQGMHTAPNGYVPMPAPTDMKIDAHTVRVFEYDDERELLKFANSWGVEWGEQGYGYMPYAYLAKYVVECWAVLPDHNWQNGKRKLGDDSYKDSQKNIYNVQLHDVKPVVPGRFHLFVLDAYAQEGTISGWVHFSLVESGNVMEIEDIFVLPQYQNLGLGSKLLALVNDTARQIGISEIRGWVSAQDIIQQRKTIVSRYFTNAGFQIVSDTVRFRGSYWRVQKSLRRNFYFVAGYEASHVECADSSVVPPPNPDILLADVIQKAANPLKSSKPNGNSKPVSS